MDRNLVFQKTWVNFRKPRKKIQKTFGNPDKILLYLIKINKLNKYIHCKTLLKY